MSSDPEARPNGGQLVSVISNRVARVISDYTGRGPTQVRTYLHDDLISVVVRDLLTKGERSLVAHGKSEVVLSMRMHFQEAMHRDLVAAVEELTGREVIAFFSANRVEPDAALESFLLAPRAQSDGLLDAVEVTAEA